MTKGARAAPVIDAVPCTLSHKDLEGIALSTHTVGEVWGFSEELQELVRQVGPAAPTLLPHLTAALLSV